MDRETFLNTLTSIGTSEDEVERRTLLASLTDEVNRVYDENSTLTESNNKYIEDNEKLRSANMQLFLKVGETKTPEDITKDKTGLDKGKDPRKFEDLFNEKGMIK